MFRICQHFGEDGAESEDVAWNVNLAGHLGRGREFQSLGSEENRFRGDQSMGFPGVVEIAECLPQQGGVMEGRFHRNGTLRQALRERLEPCVLGLGISCHSSLFLFPFLYS
jgi:hypothetical protein